MAYEKKPGDISIFKNDKAEGNQPQYRGELLTPDGKTLTVSLWVKEGKSGKFFAGKVQELFNKGESKPVERDYQRPAVDELEDEIPF